MNYIKMFKTVSKFSQVFFLLFLSVGVFKTQGQVYPVQVTTQVLPPYTPYLSDYTAAGSQRLMVNFVLRDPTLPEYRCKLRITIEGVGITIRTKASYVPEALVLPGGGVPQMFTGEDLLEYFKPDNLDFAGISRAQYEKGAKLPEGVYRFTVEVLDYNRNTLVSNKGTATAWIILNDPPLLNLPRNDTKVQILDPTNIPFTWTPRHTGSPNAAFTTEYIFRMVEIWPINRNPYDAFLSQPALYEVTSSVPQIIYGPGEPALLPGRKYAWQVQARDIEGRDLFKNDGKSEVYVFQFGDALGIPEALTLQSSTSSALTVRWDQPTAGTDAVTYRTRYRPHNNRKHEEWYEGSTNEQWKTLSSLQPNTEYEVQVRAEQTMQTSDYSNTAIFKTAVAGANDFACKSDVTPPPAPANTTPAFPLGINDTIHAGGYKVLVRGLTASGKSYTGDGFAIVPWLAGAKIRVTFKDISVNDQFWLTSGEIKSVWNADSKFLINVPTKDNPKNMPNAGDVPIGVVETDSTIVIKGAAISEVKKDPEGNIVVSTTDGKTTVLEKGKSYSIVDEIGNGYVVDKEGNIAKTTADQALAAADRGNREYNISMRFEKPATGKFGLDAKKYEPLNSYYQQLDAGDYIAWKAVTSSESDDVNAIITGELTRSKLKFEIAGVPVMPSSTTGEAIPLSVRGKAEGTVEELLAKYPGADSTKTEIVGKLNLLSYDKLNRNLVIVPVNGVGLPSGVTERSIQTELNRIYGQAVTEWKVSMAEPLKANIPADVFDDGETGLLTNYTGDMKTVINAYPGKFQSNTYYLFLVNNPKSGKGAFGYMPRSKQAGFIFVSSHANASARFINTIAHELGHGAFNLQHTFVEFALSEGATDNVMDNARVTDAPKDALYKYQWDHIHNPQRVISLFEGDDDGKSVIVNDMAKLKDFQNPDGSFTFLSVAGKPITLKGNIERVSFITSDDIWTTSENNLPLGAIVEFTIDGKSYHALKGTNTSNFRGYGVSSSSSSYYVDDVSHKKAYKNVLVGIPCWKNGDISFRVFPTSYLTENPNQAKVTAVNQGEGTEQQMYFLSKYLDREREGKDIIAEFSTKFTAEDLYFVSRQTNEQNVCGVDALYLFNIAYIVHNTPGLTLCMPDALSDVNSMLQNQLIMERRESQGTKAVAVSTAVQKPRIALDFEQKHYDEVYKEKYKEQYLVNLNSALSRYNKVIAKKSFEGLADKDISDVLTFLAIDDAKGRTCLLRNMSLPLRIELLKKHKTWTFLTLDDKEELMADLVETVPDADVTGFLDFLKSGGTYSWFWSLWGDLHMSELERFMSTLTYQVMRTLPADPALTPPTGPSFSAAGAPSGFKPPQMVVESPYVFAAKDGYEKGWSYTSIHTKTAGLGTITVGRAKSGPADLSGYTYYRNTYTGNPFDYVRVTFEDDYQFPSCVSGEKINKGMTIVVPAIWLYYILDKQMDIENFAALRVILNIGAAVITVATMEPGAFMAVELIANSIDIVVAVSEDAVASSNNETMKEIYGAWNNIYGLYGAALITKTVVNGVVKYVFNPTALRSMGRSLINTPGKLAQFSTDLYALSLNLAKDIKGFNGRQFFLTLVMKAYLEVGILEHSLRMSSDVWHTVAQADAIILSYKGKELALGRATLDKPLNKLTLHELSWYDAASDGPIKELIWKFKKAYYVSSSGDELSGAVNVLVTRGDKLRVIDNPFFNGLYDFYKGNPADAITLYNYYISKFPGLTVVQRGTEALVDGRQELLKLVSEFSPRSDLVNHLDYIDAFAFLGTKPNLRVNRAVLDDVRRVFDNVNVKNLYGNLDDVQKAVNSSSNVEILVGKLAKATTREEFEVALLDVKAIDLPASMKEFDVLASPGNVLSSLRSRYTQVLQDIQDLSLQRQNKALTQLEKTALSEKIGLAVAEREMMERGFEFLEHHIYTSNAKQGELDLIVWNNNANDPVVFAVEVKGGSSELGSREIANGQRAQQGSMAYLDDIIENMRNQNNINFNPDVARTLDMIDQARVNGNLRYVLVKQELNADGSIGKLIVKEFY